MSRPTKRSQFAGAFQVLADPCVYLEKNRRFIPVRSVERKARQAPAILRSCSGADAPAALRRRVA